MVPYFLAVNSGPRIPNSELKRPWADVHPCTTEGQSAEHSILQQNENPKA